MYICKVKNLFNLAFFKAIKTLFPNYFLVDIDHIKTLKNSYGEFYYTKPLQEYFNVFEQVDEYNITDLKPDDVVLDIGAFVGVSPIMFATKCKYVYAVEPLFTQELNENITLNNLKNVSVIPYALGPGGTINFCSRKTEIKGISFSELLKSCTLTPTFLKMDCEGGEWSINPRDLAGFRAIEAEIHNFNGENPNIFIENLESIGFKVSSYKTPEGQTMISARK